jgi:hypothetical protein
MWGRWCQFDDDSAFGLAISDKGGVCRVFSPAAPIFVVQGTVVGTARQNISMVGCCRLPFGTASRSVRVLLKVPYLHYFSPLPRPSLDEKTRSITVPVVVPASRSEGALRRTRSTPSPDLAAGPPRRSPPRQSPLAGSSPSAASAMHKTTGRLLRSPHRTPLPSSHFAADGQSARPSASFAPPPALGCSCHHYAPVNSLRASGVHRMLTKVVES